MKMKKQLSRITLMALVVGSMLTINQPAAQAQSYHTVTYQQFNWNNWYSWFQPTTSTPVTEIEQSTPAVEKTAPVEQTNTTSQSSEQTTAGMSATEVEVVKLVNEQRAKYGLAPLKASSELSVVARDKSIDMRDRNYFDHQSPSYGSPFDMMNAYGIHYRTAGENIAAGQRSAQEVVTAWMNSEGHRKNILSANFTTIGVGYVTGGSYQHYWTQMFTG